MTQIQIDTSMQHLLAGAQQPIALCDPSGKVLGHFLPEPEYLRMLYATVKSPLSEEEISRREEESGGCTLEEIWRELGQK
jgi:hypothetical protein